MKILRWLWNNIFFIFTLFLLAFIPLYPKRPVLDIQHTWVYIRLEDFVIAFIILTWVYFVFTKKISLKTPLTLPIILFWIIGGVATLHGVLLIFPTLQDVFSNVSFLSYLRRIEYILLFFIAYSGIKDKRFSPYIVGTLVVTLLGVIWYGFGQKFLGYPAFLTMNEEFAKGTPIQLSDLSRVPSTFGGHYDLAAYLVLIIPLLTSMIFGVKNYLAKVFLALTSALGFILLFMTVSRVSFFVLLISMAMMLILQKKRMLIFSLFAIALILLGFFPSLLNRFSNTVTEVQVLVDAKTGEAIGPVKEVPSTYFDNRIIVNEFATNEQDPKLATASGILPRSLIPSTAALVTESNIPTGENLPQGTSYINLPLSPITKKVNQYFYQKSDEKSENSSQIFVYYGDYILKKAKAFDLSFTTRFQGEWPKAMNAFKRNIFLGNGYGSVSLAVDNNYLRILGETGLLGFLTFLSIFLLAIIYIKKALPSISSPFVKSFALGFIAGTFGLALNALLIDVFEASKIAFTYWLLMGVTLGLVELYKTKEIDLYKEFVKAITSFYAIIVYLLAITMALFFPAVTYYFTGDDFTWFRWVSDCTLGIGQCNLLQTIFNYFTESSGFFYRPGTKLYFSFMYSNFWLNQTVYHFVSIFLHFVVSVLVFLLAKKIIKNHFLSAAAAAFFLILSGNLEAIFWISSTGFLFNAVFALSSILFFANWKEKKRSIYLILCILSIAFSMLFHELGVIVPLLIVLYDRVTEGKSITSQIFKKTYYLLLFSPIIPYLLLRLLAKSHWFSGDYSYNFFKLPFNIIGNITGYIMLSLFGPATLSFYEKLRNGTKDNIILAVALSALLVLIFIKIYRLFIDKVTQPQKKIIIFGSCFFVIALLPFLGLGNITSRYSYLSSVGFVLLFVYLLERIYYYLLHEGKNIAWGILSLVVIVFLTNHLFQLQKIHTDWNAAGEKSKRFLVSLNQVYSNGWTKEHLKFYFIDVPIRYGEAWVFPVGLDDAVWFVFRNKNINIYQLSSLEQAYNAVQDPIREKIFEFNDRGEIIEREKPQVTSSNVIIK